MSNTYFVAFLFLDAFIAGVFIAIASRHAYEHFYPLKHEMPSSPLATVVKERLLRDSEVHYQKVLDHSIDSLENDLENNSKQINNLVTRFASVIVEDELNRYRTELSKLHQQAQADMSGIKQAVAGHQVEIEAQVAAELQAEKQALIKQIDIKLGDAVGSFLVEALQHNVDLGSQEAYLLQLLEEHKADFIKEVADDDAQATK